MVRGIWPVLLLALAGPLQAAATDVPVRSWIDRQGILHLSNGSTARTVKDAHEWTTGNGTRTFSDRSPRELARERERRERLVRCYRGMATTGVLPRALAGRTVVLLSARWCPTCATARTWLRKHRIRFHEYDIERQPRGREFYAELGTSAVPVILVGRQYMYGFYAEDLARMLRHRRGR